MTHREDYGFSIPVLQYLLLSNACFKFKNSVCFKKYLKCMCILLIQMPIINIYSVDLGTLLSESEQLKFQKKKSIWRNQIFSFPNKKRPFLSLGKMLTMKAKCPAGDNNLAFMKEQSRKTHSFVYFHSLLHLLSDI